MHRYRFHAILAACAFVALTAAAPLAAPQDVTLHQTTSSTGPMAGAAPQTATLYFGRIAMKHASSDGTDFIVRYDQSKIVFVDNKKKTYSEQTFAEIEKAVADASMKGMDKESMEAMRKMMGAGSGAVKVTRQGAGENIAGYATEKYTVSMPPMEMELWSAPGLTVPEAYYNALRLQTPRNPMFDFGKLYDEMKKIKGMTVKSVMNMKMMNMSMTTTTVVNSVEKGSIPASTFEVPAGYKATSFKVK